MGFGWSGSDRSVRCRSIIDDADKGSLADAKEGLENPSFAFLLKYHGSLALGTAKGRDGPVGIIEQLRGTEGQPLRLQMDIDGVVLLSSTLGIIARYPVYAVATCTMSDDQQFVAFVGTDDSRSSTADGQDEQGTLGTVHTCHVFSNESGGSTVGVARALAVLFRAAYKNFVLRVKDRDLAVGYTGLHWAAKSGKETLVAMWLRAGADVNARSRGGYTPLHLAALHDHIPVIKMLLGAGADQNAMDNAGRRPKDLVPVASLKPARRTSKTVTPRTSGVSTPAPQITIRTSQNESMREMSIESMSPSPNRPEEYTKRRMTSVMSTGRISDGEPRGRSSTIAAKPASPMMSPRSMSFVGGKRPKEWAMAKQMQLRSPNTRTESDLPALRASLTVPGEGSPRSRSVTFSDAKAEDAPKDAADGGTANELHAEGQTEGGTAEEGARSERAEGATEGVAPKENAESAGAEEHCAADETEDGKNERAPSTSAEADGATASESPAPPEFADSEVAQAKTSTAQQDADEPAAAQDVATAAHEDVGESANAAPSPRNVVRRPDSLRLSQAIDDGSEC
eukprot:Opistho-1_new@107351